MSVHDNLRAIGERLQSAASVKTVYSEPVTVGDRTIIPVARVRFGFGAGGHEESGGGGGGLRAEPAGLIEITPSGTVFTGFIDYRRLIAAFAFGVAAGLLLHRRVKR